jgi:hypothetical protein
MPETKQGLTLGWLASHTQILLKELPPLAFFWGQSLTTVMHGLGVLSKQESLTAKD